MLKKSVVIKRRRMNIPRFNYKNLVFFVLFFCGLIIGVLTMKNETSTLKDIFSEFFVQYITNKSNESFFNCFLDSLFIIIMPTIVTYIFGLCAVGLPIIIAIPTLTGIAVGMAIGFLYSSYSLQGLGYAALIIIPSLAVVIATLIKCCSEAINMSIEIIAGISGYQSQNRRNELKDYCLRFLIFFIPLILSALLNVCSFRLFNGLFSFI